MVLQGTMMRSDIALFGIAVLTCGSLWAAAPSVAFAGNRDRVLSGECHEADGVVFGVGISRPRSDSSASRQAAREKARLAAKANMVLRRALRGVAWPDDVDVDRRREIVDKIEPFVSAKAVVKGLESVYSNVEADGRTTVVVAAPVDGVKGTSPISYADALELFNEVQRRAAARNDKGRKPEVLQDASNDDAVVDKAAQSMFVLPKGTVANENETIGF